MKKLLWPLLSFDVAAQGGLDDDPPRLGVELAEMLNDSPHANEGTRFLPTPLIKFYFRVITAGWNFTLSKLFELSVITKFRFDGFSVDDLGREELAQNGIDYQLLEDRAIAYEGLHASS